MAVTDSYATAAEYRAVIPKTVTTDDPAILVDLTAVSRLIERQCGRFFNQDAAAVARIYTREEGSDKRILWTDDISATPSSIKIDTDDDGSFADETALASTDYELRPLNADKGPEAQPWTHLYIAAWSSKSEWSAGLRVEVTAKWGWVAVPSAVKQATIRIASIMRLESPMSTQRVPESGGSIEMNPEVTRILRDLKLRYARVRF